MNSSFIPCVHDIIWWSMSILSPLIILSLLYPSIYSLSSTLNYHLHIRRGSYELIIDHSCCKTKVKQIDKLLPTEERVPYNANKGLCQYIEDRRIDDDSPRIFILFSTKQNQISECTFNLDQPIVILFFIKMNDKTKSNTHKHPQWIGQIIIRAKGRIDSDITMPIGYWPNDAAKSQEIRTLLETVTLQYNSLSFKNGTKKTDEDREKEDKDRKKKYKEKEMDDNDDNTQYKSASIDTDSQFNDSDKVKEKKSYTWVWILLGVSAIIAIILAIALFKYTQAKKKRSQRKTYIKVVYRTDSTQDDDVQWKENSSESIEDKSLPTAKAKSTVPAFMDDYIKQQKTVKPE